MVVFSPQKGEPDIQTVAKMVLNDWQRGKIPYFVRPPGSEDYKVSFAVVFIFAWLTRVGCSAPQIMHSMCGSCVIHPQSAQIGWISKCSEKRLSVSLYLTHSSASFHDCCKKWNETIDKVYKNIRISCFVIHVSNSWHHQFVRLSSCTVRWYLAFDSRFSGILLS